ncbi:mercury transporter [Streptomyces cyaneofuscatus]|uniref:mercury transporter n=1 Tax=Streptomyces cyaneofuscatus TaxID=66883 RepID=UPI0038056B8D
MPGPAADPRPRRARRALGGLAAVACVACCALPVLITAGAVGAGAGAVVGWLPVLAIVLAVLAAGTWWLGRRRGSCSCAPKTADEGGCDGKAQRDPLKITGTGTWA